MDIVLTVVTGLFTALAAFFALRASTSDQLARDAERRTGREAAKFNAMAGRLIALEGALESLVAQHRRLAGKFHAAQSERAAAAEAPPPDPMEQRVCENWNTAQVEGPLSEAASCECGYCVGRRAARERFRSTAVPRAPKPVRVAAGASDGE